MRVVLISPYSGIEAAGLRSLSACLKKAGFATRMVFLPDFLEAMATKHYNARLSRPELIEQLAALCHDADLIGITVMTPSFELASWLSDALHIVSKAQILWGGIHPTVSPEECLEHADLVCVGEGERMVVELCQRMADGAAYTDVGNLGYRDAQGAVVLNALYPLEHDLDQLPFPDFDYTDHYVLHDDKIVPFTEALMHYYLTDLGSWADGPVYGVMTTRGCPYTCSYCANNAYTAIYPGWSHIRRRSPANVIAEIQSVRTRLPRISAVILRDDTFLANARDYIAEFSQLYKQEVALPFRAYTTAQTADSAKLEMLADAGLCYVIMGIQSGAQRTKKAYQRRASNQQILDAARAIHTLRAQIPRPTYDLITDNPYENDDDRFETLQLVNALPAPYRLSLYALTFYPGTDLARTAKAQGMIPTDDRSAYRRNFQIYRLDYYNLVLFCHSLNLFKPLLDLMATKAIFRLCRHKPLDWLSGQALALILALRKRKNVNLFAKRRLDWLGSAQ
jgi:radical SAM superfamily enzyme YgiQ (UPF0313 family)